MAWHRLALVLCSWLQAHCSLLLRAGSTLASACCSSPFCSCSSPCAFCSYVLLSLGPLGGHYIADEYHRGCQNANSNADSQGGAYASSQEVFGTFKLHFGLLAAPSSSKPASRRAEAGQARTNAMLDCFLERGS